MAAKKDKLIEEAIRKPFSTGDMVIVTEKTGTGEKIKMTKVVNVLSDGKIQVDLNPAFEKNVYEASEISHYLDDIGCNPLVEEKDIMVSHEVTISYFSSAFRKNPENMFGDVYVPELNFNPYVTDKAGNRNYYQRDFVWELEDEQMFIESIYNNLDCGTVVLKENDYKEVERKVNEKDPNNGFFDVVDGKQRLHTLKRFFNDEFPDMHGNYYSDFSAIAQRRFRNRKPLKVVTLRSTATDEDVINAFLKVNYAGKPMSKEHIEYVMNIKKKF